MGGSQGGINSKITDVRSLLSGGSMEQMYPKAPDAIPLRIFTCV